MLQPKTSSMPATTPARVSGRITRQKVCHDRAPRQAAASSSVGSRLDNAVPMLMTMNGNVKIDIAKTTAGRLNRNTVSGMPSAARICPIAPFGSRRKRMPKATYSAPNIGNTISARTTSR